MGGHSTAASPRQRLSGADDPRPCSPTSATGGPPGPATRKPWGVEPGRSPGSGRATARYAQRKSLNSRGIMDAALIPGYDEMGGFQMFQRIGRIALVPLLAVAACGRGPAPPAQPSPSAVETPSGPREGGTVVIGALTDIDNWNPYLTSNSFGDDLLSLLYPTLAIEQADYREHPPSFAPSLATSWEFSADKLVLTFHLRPEARWSDGVPVTAEDLVYSWKVQTSEEIGWTSAEIKENIIAVEAVDEHTVRFRFRHAYPYQLMDVNDGPIVPAHAWKTIPLSTWEDVDWSQHTLSAGPFRFAAHEPQQQITLEKNPTYWRSGFPRLDRVVWRVLPDQSNLLIQLKTGAIDLMEAIPPREADHVRVHPRLQLIVFPDRSYGYLGWNNGKPLFNDRRVRRALTLAIDRNAILDSVLRGFGRIAVGPVLSTMWAFDRTLRPLPYDPRAALSLLEKAGWKDRDGDGILDRRGKAFRFELLTNSGNEVREDICLLIKDQLQRIGIDVEPRFVEWGALTSRLRRGQFDAYVSAWREGTQVDLAPVWHSAPPGQPTFNFVRYANARVDRLLELAGQASTIEEQKPYFFEVQKIITQDQPYTFLYEGERLDGLDRRVHGAVINDASPYFNLEEWWVSGSRR